EGEEKGDERPLIHGGRALGNWQRDGDRFWSADVPEAKTGNWDFRVLVVNGRIAQRARLPEQGHFEHLSRFDVTYMSAAGGHWQRPPTDEELTTMRYKPEDLGPWLDVNNAEVVVSHMWSESLLRLAANDANTQTLTFASKAANPPGAFRVYRYVVFNLREGLTRPGQWYLDRTAGKVVYWPLPDEDMTQIKVFAPVVQTLFSGTFAKDASRGPTFRRLKLSVTDIPATNASFGGIAYPGAIELSKAHGATFDDLEATALGGWFLKDRNSRDVAVRDCHVHQLGTSGISLSGATGLVEGNHIHHMGLLCNNGVGMYISGGENYRIRRNEVHDTPYCGMIVGGHGRGYVVEENLVYRAMQVLHDGAAFYCGQSIGLTLRRNVVRDTEAAGQGYGASAYYLDEKSRDCLIEQNVAINVSRPTHNHMTVDCTLRGNVFIHDSDMTLSFARSRGYQVVGNTFITGGKLQVGDPDALAEWSGNVVFQQQPATATAAARVAIGDQFTPVERKLREAPRTMTAMALAAEPKVDGVLDLGEWPDASTGMGETPEQLSPRGAPAVFKACVHGRSLCLAVIVVTMDPA
ncbi:MAG: right-handed parallel beta-helix repeat-containing protein, partial [Patescibacteria group bacterium]|nr:right-handed parallel beta-helix repeat-containing protein [Patescibacteria group bacterium]